MGKPRFHPSPILIFRTFPTCNAQMYSIFSWMTSGILDGIPTTILDGFPKVRMDNTCMWLLCPLLPCVHLLRRGLG